MANGSSIELVARYDLQGYEMPLLDDVLSPSLLLSSVWVFRNLCLI